MCKSSIYMNEYIYKWKCNAMIQELGSYLKIILVAECYKKWHENMFDCDHH